MPDFIASLDFNILNFIHNNFSNGFLDFIMPKISLLGNSGFIWLIAAIAMFSIKKYRKNAMVLIIGLICGVIIGNILLKNLIARERPCWINEDILMLIPVPKDYSFPSGHTLSSFIAATILMLTNKRFGIPALILAILIAFSRLYLYVHFPTDIIAGVILGITIGFTVYQISKRKLKLSSGE